MLSAPAAQISTVAASNWIRNTPSGPKPNYSQVMAITMSIVFVVCAVITACGQERLGSHFELVKRAGVTQRARTGDKNTSVEDDETKDEAVHYKDSPGTLCVEQV